MGLFRTVFSLLFLVGCVRPEWSAPLITIPAAPSVRNGITPEPEPLDDGMDRYRLSFEDHGLRPDRMVLIGTETSFVLGCTWQGNNCLTLLPEEASESFYLRIHVPRRMCPRVRIFRDDEELAVIERFRWSCVFVLEDAP
ncbi:hypothetical protein IT087_02255 [Candidatus Uhrbacteria bacterium]|nr:hypothetical protein [Candidatus Uhrbacteria bacterium]